MCASLRMLPVRPWHTRCPGHPAMRSLRHERHVTGPTRVRFPPVATTLLHPELNTDSKRRTHTGARTGIVIRDTPIGDASVRVVAGGSGVNVPNASGPYSGQSATHVQFHVMPASPRTSWTIDPSDDSKSASPPSSSCTRGSPGLDRALSQAPSLLGRRHGRSAPGIAHCPLWSSDRSTRRRRP